MQLIKYDPFTDLSAIEQNFNNLWRNDWGLLPSFAETAPMDMYEEDGKLIATVSLPNFTKKEVRVATNAGVLEITAEHQEKQENKSKRHYYLQESSNHYLRRVVLPENVDSDKVEAEFKNGTLTVTMPCTPAKDTKLIEVK